MQSYIQAIKVNPNSADLYDKLGRVYQIQHNSRYVLAFQKAEELSRMTPVAGALQTPPAAPGAKQDSNQRDVLLPLQHSGRLQSLHSELGSAGVDDGGGLEIILERAKEPHPEARPRITSDNGPQFIAKDFKEFIRVSKGECIRPGTPLSLDDGRRLVRGYVDHYNYGPPERATG